MASRGLDGISQHVCNYSLDGISQHVVTSGGSELECSDKKSAASGLELSTAMHSEASDEEQEQRASSASSSSQSQSESEASDDEDIVA